MGSSAAPRALSVCLVLAVTVVGLSGPAFAQEPADPNEGNGALRVFLDCGGGGGGGRGERFICDFEFLRQEIDFVDWVRNREDAAVHILVTLEMNDAGMDRQLEFIGLGNFNGQGFTLRYFSSFTNTSDESRNGLARTLRLGLAPFIAQTPLGASADLVVTVPEGSSLERTAPVAATERDDPWNFWTFSLGVEGDLSGEQRRDRRSFEVNARANRTTEDWKVRIGGELDYNESEFEFDDGSVFKNVSRSTDFGGQVVKSLGPRWGAGVGASMRRSTFFNLAPSYRVAGAIERNIFPYTESSQRELLFTYFVGATRFNYSEVTLFDKLQETLIDQGLLVTLDVRRPWGSASFNFKAEHFLQHAGDVNLEFSGRLDYRITRGLSFNINGNVSRIRSQRFLARGGASDEEVLLERRALATDSRFSVGFGLRYTFGSIYNNVVNSRLGSRRGGFNTIF